MPYAPKIALSVAVLALLGTSACSDDNVDGRAGSCDSLLAGDLVVSEIMSNPLNTDTGREWFEIFNATQGDIGLSGVSLFSAAADGSKQKGHIIDSLLVEAGGFVVVGAVVNDPELLPEHIDYGYGRDLGDLRNTAGQLAIACGDAVIDQALYAASPDGVSRIYTGDRTPDAAAADDLNFWCDSTTPLGDEEFGTPGGPNDVCEGVGSPTECAQDGTIRPVVPPTAGGVVITEFMSNPKVVGDAEGEWIEIYFTQDADLNGLEVSKEDNVDLILDTECHHFTAGSYAVIARQGDPEVNGGLPRIDGLFKMSLSNSNSTVSIGYGGEVLDTVTWSSSGDGKATQLDPEFLSPDANDNEDVFCDAVTAYGAGDFGTPGDANDQCEIPAPDGECFEPDGSTRPVVAPAPGDIVITEFHANPDAGEDADAEWIEVRANGSFDLNGLEIRRAIDDAPDPIEAGDCIPLSAGDYAVLARDRDPLVNGGLPQVDGLFGVSLVNSNGRLSVGYDGVELDIITWTSSQAGAATQLAPGLTDPEDNDDEANWCPAAGVYGDGDLGSPGADNPACGGVANGMCTDGGSERTIAAPAMGDLVITEIMADPSAVSDSDGEWFEVKNTSGAAVDLNGLQMGFDDGASSAELPGGGDCLSLPADGYAVLVGNPDMAANGGLPADALDMGFSSLGNSSRTLWIGYGETHWDEFLYANAVAGVAWSLDPSAESTTGNDAAENICEATDPYGAGDLGTPGAAGPTCPGSVGDGQCLDGGVPRAIVSPVAGDVVINEWMANPDAVADGVGEWFEVYVGADVDLNGLQLSTGGSAAWTLRQTLSGGDCLSVTAGTYVLFAADTVTLNNGGLPAVDFEITFGLTNTNTGIAVGVADVYLDEVDYASVSAGSSTQLDPGSMTPAGNDNVANRCAATMPYGDGDNGTPGAANPAC